MLAPISVTSLASDMKCRKLSLSSVLVFIMTPAKPSLLACRNLLFVFDKQGSAAVATSLLHRDVNIFFEHAVEAWVDPLDRGQSGRRRTGGVTICLGMNAYTRSLHEIEDPMPWI